MDKLLLYFDLGLYPSRAHLGASTKDNSKLKAIWTISYYFCVFLGVLANNSLVYIHGIETFSMPSFLRTAVLSIIMSIVVFPHVYKAARFNPSKANIMQLFVAFQFGFFFDVVFTEIQSGFGK